MRKKSFSAFILSVSAFLTIGTSAAFADSKTFTVQPNNNSTFSAANFSTLDIPPSITITGETKCTSSIFSGAHATATTDTDVQVDTLYAKVRVYDSGGGIISSKEDLQPDTSHASAKATNTNVNLNGDYAIGTHRYTNEGYDDFSFETDNAW